MATETRLVKELMVATTPVRSKTDGSVMKTSQENLTVSSFQRPVETESLSLNSESSVTMETRKTETVATDSVRPTKTGSVKRTTISFLYAGEFLKSAETERETRRPNSAMTETTLTETDATEDAESQETGSVPKTIPDSLNVRESQKPVEMVSSMKERPVMMETESTETDAEETVRSKVAGGVLLMRPEPLTATRSLRLAETESMTLTLKSVMTETEKEVMVAEETAQSLTDGSVKTMTMPNQSVPRSRRTVETESRKLMKSVMTAITNTEMDAEETVKSRTDGSARRTRPENPNAIRSFQSLNSQRMTSQSFSRKLREESQSFFLPLKRRKSRRRLRSSLYMMTSILKDSSLTELILRRDTNHTETQNLRMMKTTVRTDLTFPSLSLQASLFLSLLTQSLRTTEFVEMESSMREKPVMTATMSLMMDVTPLVRPSVVMTALPEGVRLSAEMESRPEPNSVIQLLDVLSSVIQPLVGTATLGEMSAPTNVEMDLLKKERSVMEATTL